jgi:hypothetical protein
MKKRDSGCSRQKLNGFLLKGNEQAGIEAGARHGKKDVRGKMRLEVVTRVRLHK